MGNCFSSKSVAETGSRGVLFLGLDGAGATTILYQLVLHRRLETIPTLGVNHEILHTDDLELEFWDIGGLDKMRPLWRQYSHDADAVIFVVDSADEERMRLAAQELAGLYTPNKKTSIDHSRPLLIFANKQDLSGALSIQTVDTTLHLQKLPLKTYKIFPCTANDRQSLLKGISWLTTELKGRRPVHHPSAA